MNKTKVKINGRQVFNRDTKVEIVKQDTAINGRQVYSLHNMKQIKVHGNKTGVD